MANIEIAPEISDIQEEAPVIMGEEIKAEINTPTIGDVIQLDEGTKFYKSGKQAYNESGDFGVVKEANKKLNPSGPYTVTGMILLNTNTGKVIEFKNMEAGVGIEQLCADVGIEQDKLEESDIAVVYHVNKGAGLENSKQRGWIKYDPQNYQILQKYQLNNVQGVNNIEFEEGHGFSR